MKSLEVSMFKKIIPMIFTAPLYIISMISSAAHVSNRPIYATEIVNSAGSPIFNFPASLPSANSVCTINGNNEATGSSVSTTTLGYLDATSSIQTQLNGKQTLGSYLTGLSGDGTASGPGVGALTLSNTSVTPGSYMGANITVDSKGRITAASNGPMGTVTSVSGSSPIFSSGGSTPNITIQPGTGTQNGYLRSTDWLIFNNKQDGPLTGDVTTIGAAATLSNTAVSAGSYTNANITVDHKGRVTSAANGTGPVPGGTSTQLQYNNSGAFGGIPGSSVNAANSWTGFMKSTPLAPVHAGTTSLTIAVPTGGVATTTNLFSPTAGYVFGSGNKDYNVWSTITSGGHTLFSTTFEDIPFTEPDYTQYDVPAIADPVINYSGTGYIASGYDYSYYVIAVYGSAYQNNIDLLQSNDISDDNSGNPYEVDESWTPPINTAGLTGYLIYNAGSNNPNTGLCKLILNPAATSFVDNNAGFGWNPTDCNYLVTAFISYDVSISATFPGGATGIFFNTTDGMYLASSNPATDSNGSGWTSGTPIVTPTIYSTNSVIADGALSAAGGIFTVDGPGNVNSLSLNQTSPQIEIGPGAGSGNTSLDTVYLGTNAGNGATGSDDTFFALSGAGQGATGTGRSFFAGVNAGKNAVNAGESFFVGYDAGNGASNANNSNFIGAFAGQNATGAQDSTFFGNNAGFGATGAQSSTFIGVFAGQNATGAQNSTFIGFGAGSGSHATGSIFMGTGTGTGADSASGNSVFLGAQAGGNATSDANSFFMGVNAGQNASGSSGSVFIGNASGGNASGAGNSVFIGPAAGEFSTANTSSFFLGFQSGLGASNDAKSIFLGLASGAGTNNASNAIFIGQSSGQGDTVNNSTTGYWSMALGPHSGTGGYSNSMALGRGVKNAATTEANFGNVLYLEGIYNSDTQSSTPITTGSVVTQSPLKLNDPLTTISGSVGGTAKWSMPFQGTAYKKFVINYQSFHDAGHTVTFPVAFTNTPYCYGDSTALAVSSASTTTFTIAVSAAITGSVFCEGE